MRIVLTIGGEVLSATLNDSQSTRDFVALLPLTLIFHDLLEREKYAGLPQALSPDAPRAFSYEIGQIAYWSPGPDVAIFYRQDLRAIPHPGIIVLGCIDGPVTALDVPGPMSITIELAERPA
jgi:hypothetical protein